MLSFYNIQILFEKFNNYHLADWIKKKKTREGDTFDKIVEKALRFDVSAVKFDKVFPELPVMIISQFLKPLVTMKFRVRATNIIS